MKKTWRIKCSQCGKGYDSPHPVRDDTPQDQLKCEGCSEKEVVK